MNSIINIHTQVKLLISRFPLFHEHQIQGLKDFFKHHLFISSTYQIHTTAYVVSWKTLQY